MKKKLMSLALVALLTASASVSTFAQSNSNEKAKTEKNDKKQRADKKQPRVNNPFEGLNLTEAQRAKLADLDKSKTDQRKRDKEAAMAARKEQAGKMKQARLDERKKYLADVRQIIGEANYVQFLENYYVNGQRPVGRHGKLAHNRGKMNRDKKNGQRPGRGQRPDKGQRQAQAAPGNK